MKKFLLCLIVLVFFIGGLSYRVEAANEEQIQPYYLEIVKVTSELSISSTDVATCNGKVSLYETGNTTNLVMTLQRDENGSWTNVKTWSTTGTSASLTLNKSWNVATGYEYRLKVTATVYDTNGETIESVTAYDTASS